jgi:hypothetical protein
MNGHVSVGVRSDLSPEMLSHNGGGPSRNMSEAVRCFVARMYVICNPYIPHVHREAYD